jgi:UDP-glucose 4-epimerase
LKAWVIGGGGLLGSSVRRALYGRGDASLFEPGQPLPWLRPEQLGAAMAASATRFLDEAASEPRWAVVWCAGSAVVASPAREVAVDVSAWALFLDVLRAALDANREAAGRPGCLVLASSAGGVWGGHRGSPIDEQTPVVPISDYGQGHLERERALGRFTSERPGVRSAVVRLSNLYGPDQRLDKPQGLISHVARSVIHRRPIQVYVSLDTVRDYLFAPDAGRGMGDVIDRLLENAPATARPVVKILASEEEISIGGLLALFRRVTRRPVAVTAGLRPVGRLQPFHLSFRSTVWPEVGRGARTPLLHGVAVVFRRQLEQYASGTLPAPPAPGIG